MPPPALRLWLALLELALAVGCGTTQSALPVLAADAPLRYSAYCDTPGHVRSEAWALALMGHASHREQVYLQAREGLYPASEVWLHLESVCRGAGGVMAEEHAGRKCALLPPELGCEFNWNPVRSLMPGEGPGQQRLLEVYKEGYDARWEQVKKGYRLRAETARAGMLVAGVALGRSPAAAESQAETAEARAAAAEGRALGADAHIAATEAGVAGDGAGALLSAETLGLSRELGAEEASALETRLLEWEAESRGTREAFSLEELRSGRLAAKARPAEVAEDSALWREFEGYRQRRFRQVRAQGAGGKGAVTAKPPLRWEAYQELREHFQASIAFETQVGGVLVNELEQEVGSRRLLKDSRQPLIARHVGTKKAGVAGVLYPDYLVVDEATLEEGTPRVDSMSVKKRNFANKSDRDVRRQVEADAEQAKSQYGGQLEVRRLGHPLYNRTIQVSKVHLVYDTTGVGKWKMVIQEVCDQHHVEVHFE
ncbi:MAG: hypothetical protein ACJ8AT_14775 [Hyalangium sp.]|uniref:hypothetical protein n=1 Tax=Hyalangium sp. TaxID=2028555 RepID=UPI00389B0F9E